MYLGEEFCAAQHIHNVPTQKATGQIATQNLISSRGKFVWARRRTLSISHPLVAHGLFVTFRSRV